MVKRKNLQYLNNLEPHPKKPRYFYNNKTFSNLNILSLSKSINEINKTCKNINNINFKPKSIKLEVSYIYDYYFL